MIASLSKESILKRRRKNIIGMQITAISWMLEFLASNLVLVRFWGWQTSMNTEWTDRIIFLFILVVNIILIPGSYMLNDEAMKLLILANSWTSVFRSNLVKCFRRNDSLNENNQMP